MILPANLQTLAVALTSSGTANTVTTGTLVAAPGAGLRLRLWGFGCQPSSTAQAVVNWRCFATDTVGGASIAQAAGATFAAPPIYWIPGGQTITTNGILGFSLSSALISALFSALVHYTTEAV